MILWLYEKFRHHCIFLISLIFCNSDEDLFIIQSCSSYFNGFSHSHRLLYILIIRTSTRSADKQVHRRRGGFGVLHSRIRLGVHRPSVRVSVCLSVYLSMLHVECTARYWAAVCYFAVMIVLNCAAAIWVGDGELRTQNWCIYSMISVTFTFRRNFECNAGVAFRRAIGQTHFIPYIQTNSEL